MATSSNTWKFIWLIHQEQDVPERKKEFYVLTQGMWGTTGYRTKNGIRKTPTGCWGFLLSKFYLGLFLLVYCQ